MEYSLHYILAPISLDGFRTEIYTRKAFLIKGTENKFDKLFSFSDLNQILNTSPIPHPTLKLVKEAVPIFVSNFNSIIEACKGGASLIIDELHKYNSNVAKLATCLSYDLNEPIQINMYLGQPDIKGFNNHYDCHDVFIFQTEGFKRWRVYEPTLNFPLFTQKFHGKTPPEKPYLDCILFPGDLLYIPRGHWHEAIAANKPSLHLTVGILAKTGIDFLIWLSDELRDTEFFRKSLPLLYPEERNNSEKQNELKEHFLEVKNKLIEKLENENLISDFFKFYISKEYHFEPFNLPYQFQKEKIDLSSNASLIRNSFQSFKIEQNGNTFDLISSGKIITLKNSCERFVKYLVTTDRVKISEINYNDFDINENQAGQVIDCLVKEGIIKYANE